MRRGRFPGLHFELCAWRADPLSLAEQAQAESYGLVQRFRGHFDAVADAARAGEADDASRHEAGQVACFAVCSLYSRGYHCERGLNPDLPLPNTSCAIVYEGILSGATFYRSNDFHFQIRVSGSSARLVIGEYGLGFTEDLGSSTVEIWAALDASMNASSSAGSFTGAFTYCDGLPAGTSGTYWSCPVRPAYCEALNHQFTLTRR